MKHDAIVRPGARRGMPLTALLTLLLVALACSGEGAKELSADARQAIADELLTRLERDQYYRGFDYSAAPDTTRRRVMQEAIRADSSNLAYMRELVARIGWPDSERFGPDAASAAFVLVQHADRDPEFQARMLTEMTAAVERGEASARDLAFLIDRVRVKQGRPQVYGTQYDVARDSLGNVVLGPDGRPRYVIPVVEDVEMLDSRRAAVGLNAWAAYEEDMARLQGRTSVERPQRDTLRAAS